jgi:hypothetical protein
MVFTLQTLFIAFGWRKKRSERSDPEPSHSLSCLVWERKAEPSQNKEYTPKIQNHLTPEKLPNKMEQSRSVLSRAPLFLWLAHQHEMEWFYSLTKCRMKWLRSQNIKSSQTRSGAVPFLKTRTKPLHSCGSPNQTLSKAPRIHFFLWLVSNNKILTRYNISKRKKVVDDKTCLYCLSLLLWERDSATLFSLSVLFLSPVRLNAVDTEQRIAGKCLRLSGHTL